MKNPLFSWMPRIVLAFDLVLLEPRPIIQKPRPVNRSLACGIARLTRDLSCCASEPFLAIASQAGYALWLWCGHNQVPVLSRLSRFAPMAPRLGRLFCCWPTEPDQWGKSAGLSRLSPLNMLLRWVRAITRHMLWGRAFSRGCGHPYACRHLAMKRDGRSSLFQIPFPTVPRATYRPHGVAGPSA